MNVPIPWAFALKVLKAAFERATNWMFMPTLLASHRHWLSRRGLFAHWQAIGRGIEYSLHIPTKHFENTATPVARIALRCCGGEIDSLVVTVEARLGKIVYDETRLVSSIRGEVTRVIALPGIPLQNVFSTEDGVGCSYDSFRVRISSITERGVTRVINLSGPSCTPTFTDYLNGRFTRRQGLVLNMDEIEWQKGRIREAVWGHLGVFPEAVFRRRTVPVAARPVHSLKVLLGKFLTWKLVINLAFWLPLILRLKKFKPEE